MQSTLLTNNMNTENITKPINQLTEKYQDVQDRALETARNMCNVTDTFVRDNPWWMLGMVAVAALTVGLLLGQTTARS